jgi:hypothetical protein
MSDTPARPDAGTTPTLYEDMARIAAQGTDGRSLIELRLTIARALDEIDRLTAEWKRLEAENARLRMLVGGVMDEDRLAGGHGCFPDDTLCAGNGAWHTETCKEARALASAGDKEPRDG